MVGRLLKHSWFHRTALVLLMQVLGAVLAYGSFATLARNMTSEGYGQLQYILSWSVLLGIFGGLGIPLW
ncbi:MAG: oligosaccharide flippase family protein, partial [Bdellovibrionales bacterium]|nr:oligosaccharide flippase family protein [Bdellovibrionales bacterium]